MMQYITDKSPRKRKKGKGFTPARNGRNVKQVHAIQSHIHGGPNMEFLNKHGLDEHSHPMDWFNALLPMTPNDNLEDLVKANVKCDKTWKFAVSNWAEYMNTKAKLSNAGKEGYIFAGVYRDFQPQDIMKMMGVYVIDGLAPSPRLVQKCNLSQNSVCMKMTSLQCVSGLDTNKPTNPFATSLVAKIPSLFLHQKKNVPT